MGLIEKTLRAALAFAEAEAEQRGSNDRYYPHRADELIKQIDAALDALRPQADLTVTRTGFINALDEHGMWSNPDMFDQAAREIDCGAGCEHVWHESDTNAGGCHKADRGEFCPWEVAETLRGLERLARMEKGE